MAMQADSYIIVRVTPDFKNYTWWEVRGNDEGGIPNEPPRALGNRTTSASTLGTAIQNAMPTLGT